jgi:hypothetical protein
VTDAEFEALLDETAVATHKAHPELTDTDGVLMK